MGPWRHVGSGRFPLQASKSCSPARTLASDTSSTALKCRSVWRRLRDSASGASSLDNWLSDEAGTCVSAHAPKPTASGPGAVSIDRPSLPSRRRPLVGWPFEAALSFGIRVRTFQVELLCTDQPTFFCASKVCAQRKKGQSRPEVTNLCTYEVAFDLVFFLVGCVLSVRALFKRLLEPA